MVTIITSLISAISLIIIAIINKNTNKKVEDNTNIFEQKFNEIKEEILKEVENNREEYTKQINNHILENDKTYLTDFMADVEAGEPKAEMQITRAYEIKAEYDNLVKGDTYIKNKWKELVRKNFLRKKKNIK